MAPVKWQSGIEQIPNEADLILRRLVLEASHTFHIFRYSPASLAATSANVPKLPAWRVLNQRISVPL